MKNVEGLLFWAQTGHTNPFDPPHFTVSCFLATNGFVQNLGFVLLYTTAISAPLVQRSPFFSPSIHQHSIDICGNICFSFCFSSTSLLLAAMTEEAGETGNYFAKEAIRTWQFRPKKLVLILSIHRRHCSCAPLLIVAPKLLIKCWFGLVTMVTLVIVISFTYFLKFAVCIVVYLQPEIAAIKHVYEFSLELPLKFD